LSRINVYMVEDDPDDVQLMDEALKNCIEEYDFAVSSHGDMVQPYLQTCKTFPDIIILDLNLPKRDGKELLKFIKTSEEYNSIPVIILTTSSSKTDIDYCLSNGASSFLSKPMTMEGYFKIAKSIFVMAGKRERVKG
jgi:CheY-like chemotaxis protein